MQPASLLALGTTLHGQNAACGWHQIRKADECGKNLRSDQRLAMLDMANALQFNLPAPAVVTCFMEAISFTLPLNRVAIRAEMST